MNRLIKEKSPYLAHAAHQKIDWYPWSDEAFETSRREDKPVFLSSGAVWCHWCHVMAKECFEDESIVGLLNENFVCVKLDRDERPDIDRRYQQALHAMGSGGGWPLSMFLTPDKRPFFGGTYFPPEDSFGRPGFKRVLKAIVLLYHEKRGEMIEHGKRIIDALRQMPAAGNEIRRNEIERAASAILSRFDPTHGGFGTAPKFPAPGALEFLINRHFFTREESSGTVVKTTLESMAKGGFYDQIGGGFHRYSVDEAWIIPHFEKMADDNAWHLRNYVDAYALFGDARFGETALGIIGFLRGVLSNPGGGFYVSQDADVVPEDEGGYFTWTEDELREALNKKEFEILSLHLLDEKGAMPHDRSRKVLFIAMEPSDIAEETGLDTPTVSEILRTAKRKLLGRRNRRKPPLVDKTFYTSLNGMLISSFFRAFRVFGDTSLSDFALKSLGRIIERHLFDGALFHTEGVNAMLDDYVYLIEALVAAYEVTGEPAFLAQADELMEVCIDKFWDRKEGGFFDTEEEVIDMRLKSAADLPHPSANSLGVILLLKLHYSTGKETYHRYAEESLKVFSTQADEMGMHGGFFFCALDAYYHMIKLTLHAPPEQALAKTALSTFRPYVSILYGQDTGCVIPCTKDLCHEPISDPGALMEFLQS